ncbi:MAG TPA: ribosome biogenesis GTP-binding protein YihA/YsxC [Tissierellaceae bacterium]
MKITKSELECIAVSKDYYPEEDSKEIAFVGRSNVGKSSFINSLINRKNLARTSSKPGKTRTINFYRINDLFRFVDLPGYGYAKVSKSEKEKWGHIITEYLEERKNLKEVILIVDFRHEPTNDDLGMYEWIKHYGYTGIVIGTKADKISKGQWQKHEKIIRQKLKMTKDCIFIPYSSEKGYNKDKVYDLFEDILNN